LVELFSNDLSMSKYKGYGNYKIAVRSYKRSKLIGKHTLALLKKNKIPKN